MDYAGIGKINFFVFLVVFFMIVGVVGAIFDPVGNGMVATEQDLIEGAGGWGIDVDRTGETDSPNPLSKDSPSVGGSAWDVLTTVFSTVVTALRIFWIGLTFNIPGVPLLIRMFMVIPVVVSFVAVILDIIIELLKAVFKVPMAG